MGKPVNHLFLWAIYTMAMFVYQAGSMFQTGTVNFHPPGCRRKGWEKTTGSLEVGGGSLGPWDLRGIVLAVFGNGWKWAI